MSTTNHKVAVILAVAYFAALAAIVFWPSPVDKPADDSLVVAIAWLRAQGFPKWLVDYTTIEAAANVALFIPFGAIVTLRLHSKLWWLCVPLAAAASGAIEWVQGKFLPERFASVGDILANTAGAVLGSLLVLTIWALRRRPLRSLG